MLFRARITWIAVIAAVCIAAIAWHAWLRSTGNAAIVGNDRVDPAPAQPVTFSIASPPLGDDATAAETYGAIFSQSLPAALKRNGATTVADAWALLRRSPANADRSEYLRALLRFCLEIDPAAMTDAVAQLADIPLRDLGVTFALETWSEHDAGAALGWAVAHSRPDTAARWFDTALKGFGARSPDEVIAFLQRPELGGDIASLARSIVFHFDQQGRLADVRTSIERMSESPARDTLISQVAHFWALHDPDTAAAWLEIVGSDRTFSEGMDAILQAVAPTESLTAVDATQQIPPGQNARDVRSDLVFVWAKRDLGGVAVWLHTQTPSTSLDAAIALLVEESAFFDPVEARAWLNTMTDPRRRTELARRWGI